MSELRLKWRNREGENLKGERRRGGEGTRGAGGMYSEAREWHFEISEIN